MRHALRRTPSKGMREEGSRTAVTPVPLRGGGDPGGGREPLLLLSACFSGARLDHSLSVMMVRSEKVWFFPWGLHHQAEREMWPARRGRVSNEVVYESCRPRGTGGADRQCPRCAGCLRTALGNPVGEAAAFPTRSPRTAPSGRPQPALGSRLCSQGVTSGLAPSFLAAVGRRRMWMRAGVSFRNQTP